MRRNTPANLGQHFTAFVEAQVAGSHYASAEDVLRAGLRLLEEREAELAALHAALIEGEESGASLHDVLDIWDAVRAEYLAVNG